MARILIVDDASFMRSSLKFIIESAGHEVVGLAENGMEAIKLCSELKPDLVTCDILMKNLNGIAALERIMEDNPETKVIMVTAIGQESMQIQAKQSGAKGYIRKPFKSDDVIAEINKVLAGQ